MQLLFEAALLAGGPPLHCLVCIGTSRQRRFCLLLAEAGCTAGMRGCSCRRHLCAMIGCAVADLPGQRLTACVLCALHAVRCALPLRRPASRQQRAVPPAKFIRVPTPPLPVARSQGIIMMRHHVQGSPKCSSHCGAVSAPSQLPACRLALLLIAGGFMIESPRDFAARIYSLMEGSSGASASSGSGSGSSGAAPTVDPEVL